MTRVYAHNIMSIYYTINQRPVYFISSFWYPSGAWYMSNLWAIMSLVLTLIKLASFYLYVINSFFHWRPYVIITLYVIIIITTIAFISKYFLISRHSPDLLHNDGAICTAVFHFPLRCTRCLRAGSHCTVWLFAGRIYKQANSKQQVK